MALKLCILISLAILASSDIVPKCKVVFRYARPCKRYEFNNKDCFPWDLSRCKLKSLKVDYKCPFYECQVLINSLFAFIIRMLDN